MPKLKSRRPHEARRSGVMVRLASSSVTYTHRALRGVSCHLADTEPRLLRI